MFVQELEKEWEHQQGEEHILRNQLKRLQDDLRRVNRQVEKEQKEKNNLEEKIGERWIMLSLEKWDTCTCRI